MFRVLPPDQCLNGVDRTVAHVELGLEVNVELVVVKGIAEITEQVESAPLGRLDTCVIALDRCTHSLGLVHRYVGGTQ